MPLLLSSPSSPYISYSTTLGGVSVNFTYKWSVRLQVWYVDIIDDLGNVFALGSKLVPDTPLIRFNEELAPEGNVYLIKTGVTEDTVASFDNIGEDKAFELRYYTNDEIDAIVGLQ